MRPNDVRELFEHAKDTLTVRRVFGEPYARGDVTMIAAARVRGGVGGGTGEGPYGESSGTGGGFAVDAEPVGAFVIHGDDVRWRPALDLNRVILGGQVVAVIALLVARKVRLPTRRP